MCSRSAKITPRRLRARSLLALTTFVVFGGCAAPHALPPPVTPYDYRDRHPIVLTEAPQVLDLFPYVEGGRLDSESLGRLRDFISRYKEFGHGRISVMVPTGSSSANVAAGSVDVVKRALASAGLGGVVVTGAYPVVDPKLAAPIRLSFQSLKAKVSNRCGEWPEDLASGTSTAGWQNETYWNFGCATQATLSAQVADPRDLANPRGETPSDVEMRMRAIKNLRQGSDPSTSWRVNGASISGVGG